MAEKIEPRDVSKQNGVKDYENQKLTLETNREPEVESLQPSEDLSPTTQLVNATILESLYELQLEGDFPVYSSESDLNRSQLEPILEESSEEEASIKSWEDPGGSEAPPETHPEPVQNLYPEPVPNLHQETPSEDQENPELPLEPTQEDHPEQTAADPQPGSEGAHLLISDTSESQKDSVQDSADANQLKTTLKEDNLPQDKSCQDSADVKFEKDKLEAGQSDELDCSERTDSVLAKSIDSGHQSGNTEDFVSTPETTRPNSTVDTPANKSEILSSTSASDLKSERSREKNSLKLKSVSFDTRDSEESGAGESVTGSERTRDDLSVVRETNNSQLLENTKSAYKPKDQNLKTNNTKKSVVRAQGGEDDSVKDHVIGTEKTKSQISLSRTPGSLKMGAGASKDGEFIEAGMDGQYATRSQAPIHSGSPSGSQITQRSRSPLKRKGSSISRHLSKSQLGITGHPHSASHFSTSVSKFIDGYEEAIIRITKVGFSMPEITIMEGQIITFIWEEQVSLIQVIYDGEKLRPVIGGYQASPDEGDGQYEQQFNLEGEYKFALSGVRCTPLSVIVRRRMDLQAVVTDEGFSPDIIYIDQGHTVKWSWKQCAVPHTIKEVVFCMDRGCFRKQPANTSVVATISGSYRHTFSKAGLYYFQTEAQELGHSHLCVVHVRAAQREHKVEILDRSFQPMILLIEEGDRVWFYWDKHKCKKHHSIYEVEAPALDLGEDEPYVPIKDGFRWSTPSKQGMMSHEFHKTGVYYFSDQSFEEAAEYLGTVIVKPRQKEHFIDLKEKGFSPDLLFATTGDRIWWTWDGEGIVNVGENLLILEEDKCLNPIARRPSAETDVSADMYIDMDDTSAKLLTRVGHSTYHFTTIGVYNFRVADTGDSFTTCSIIVNPGSRNHTVHLTDNGFEPKVITIRPNDRVWWVWQSGKKQHNIIQVSHQGVPISGGFASGQPRDSPSAFAHQFIMPGVYYFISKNLPKVFGAVVVATQPQVHEIAVTSSEIRPDPVTIQINDIVAWVFRNPRIYDVAMVETVDQILDAQFSDKVLAPRRCITRALTSTGIKHFHSKSFQKQKGSNYMQETRLSSVLVDERYDNEVIRVDKQGFHPSKLFLQKGQSVLWTWKGSDQPHNIIHVNSPDSDNPLNVIQGAQSFNSGKLVANNSFLYTFDEEGDYTVASQGAPGFSCTICVMEVAQRCGEPKIKSEFNGGTVERYCEVLLGCDTQGSDIYYTTDGSLPALHTDSTKLYKAEKGIILRETGLCFVRAIAIADDHLNSHVFTSSRFWVLTRGGEDREAPIDDSLQEDLEEPQTSTSAWNWWNCRPEIKACFTSPGVMEVFWEKPPEGALDLVKGYQVFLNGVTYCDMFPKDNNSINVSGMAGNRMYEVYVEVYPKRPNDQIQKSNKLHMRCPSIAPDGGPVISVEVGEKSDSLTIVWMSMDTNEVPIDGYLVFLDDQQCGPKLVPDVDSNRCKVIIGSCELDKVYKIYVQALLRDTDETRMSNVLEVELPLDKTMIQLPGEDQRKEEEEVYKEFLEIHEGSGYLPEMDTPPGGEDEETVDGGEVKKMVTMQKPVLLDASTLEEKTQQTVPPKVIEVETRGPPLFPGRKRRLRSYPTIEIYKRIKLDRGGPTRSGLSRFKKSVSVSGKLGRLGRGFAGAFQPKPAEPEPKAIDKSKFKRQASRLATLGRVGFQQKSIPEVKPPPEPELESEYLNLKTVANKILKFVSREKRIQNALAPSSNRRIHIDWNRLKGFANLKAMQRPRVEEPEPDRDEERERGRYHDDYRRDDHYRSQQGYDPEYDDYRRGGHRSRSQYRDSYRQGSFDRSPHRLDGFRRDSLDPSPSRGERYRQESFDRTSRRDSLDPSPARGERYRQASFDRSSRMDSLDPSPHRDRLRRDSLDPSPSRGDKYRQASFEQTSRDRQGSFDRSPNRLDSRYDDRRGYERTPSRSDYDQDEYRTPYERYPHEEDPRKSRRSPVPPDYDYYERRSTDRSPGRMDKHDWYRRDFFRRSSDYESDDYMQPPANSRDYDWHMYDSHRRQPREKGYLQRQSSDPRPDSKKLMVPVYRGDEDSDDFGDEEAEHIYQVNRYKTRRKSAPEEKRQKEVQFNFGPSDHAGTESENTLTPSPRILERDYFSPRPHHKHPTNDAFASRPTRQSNANLKSILKHSDFFQDPSDNIDIHDEEDGQLTPPGEYGGMLHRYLEIFENSPHREDSDSCLDEDDNDDQGVMTDDILEKSTQTPRNRMKHGQQDNQFVPPSLMDRDESESEVESSEYDSDDENEGYREYNAVVLDAEKNQATETPPKKKSVRPRDDVVPSARKRHGDMESDDELSVQRPDSGRKKKRNIAIVEVQQEVELDMDKDREVVQGGGDRKLNVPGTRYEGSMRQIEEGQFILGDGDGILPAPSIMVESRGKNGVRVEWDLPKSVDPQYKLLLYVVNVVGTKFNNEINSDISFECNLVEKGKPVRGVQHCWNVSDKQRCTVKGLLPGLTYRVYVIANYTMVHGQQSCEIQTTSSVLYYTTMGPPKPPKIRIVNVDLYQAVVEWDPPAMHPDLRLKGYQIYVDNKKLGGVRPNDVRQMVINNLVPGKTLSVKVVAITSRASQESEPSRTIHVTCPRRPPAVSVSQQPSYKKGCVLVAWDKPRYTHASNDEEISLYGIYIDGHWHGEVKANKMSDKQGYQFFLTDLSPEQPYDISIQAICGTRRVDNDAQHIYCLSDSGMSNIVPVMAPAAPKSPKLRLEGLHPEGIDVTWQVPQQFGDASISGYQMLKNGKLYGSIIPPDVNSLRIRDLMLGEKVQLQLIALTEHPVGKDTRKSLDGDSGIGGSSQPDEKITVAPPESQKLIVHANGHPSGIPSDIKDVFVGDRYSGCKPGPKLVVHYTGLVQPPREVWCEQATGHSALIVWNTDFEGKAHFVRPGSYQVTWWPGDRPEEEINSDSTTEDHLLITNLRPCTPYTVVVEARKMEKYTDIDEGTYTETPDGLNAFILTSKSDQLSVKTASPPDPPRNLGVLATTCNSLKVAWDPPMEHGVEVMGMRVECVSLNANDPHHVCVDAMPDAKMACVENLREKTDYLIRVIAITDEYFDRLPDKHRYKKHHTIPKEAMISPDDSVWLPNASILAKTAGTEPPTNIKVVKASTTSMTLSWTPPLVYGSNKLQGQIVRWADVKRGKLKDEDLVVASHVNLLATEDSLTIDDLAPGAQYRVVIEAVVSIKTSLDPDKWDSGIEKYRRTAHVMSKALITRTRAPIEPPRLMVSSYTQNTANLYWEKPPLMSVIGKDEDGRPKYLRRYLEGYKLEINGKLQCCLGPAAQSCTLTKCKPGKNYSVTLVALTCTEEAKKERKQKYKGFFKNTNPQDLDYVAILDDPENLDESPSDSVEVKLPQNQEGFISTLSAEFIHQAERDNKTFGDVALTWTTQGQISPLKQFNIVWYCEDRVIQTKYIQPTQTECTIPITKIKATYNITVEPVYFTDAIPQTAQDIQIMIPGPPDAPEIFLRSSEPEEFIIEWGEPKLYGGVKVKGYQVYMNDKKAGNELSSSHRKAVIPCRPNRTYKINLVALSSHQEYNDSPKSNTLLVNTCSSSPRPGDNSLSLEDWSSTADDHEIPLKVTRIAENAIHLDWSTFLETEGITFYKIQWSSVAQPAQREVRLSEKDSNCVINKCLPGTTHFVRLVGYNDEGQIMDKSKQLTVQTSAPPDAPLLSIRACNFRYIAIQWDKPTTYGDALVTGYKVYVNGIVESILNADQLSFTFTHGKWCQEYSFQVQALTASDRLNSKPSEPLIVSWPGVKPPPIFRIPSISSSTLRVGWESPYMTEGIKVKHFRLCCIEEDTEKLVQSIGPIHPDTREAEFKHLKKGNYSVYLETHLYGTSDIVRSDTIRMQPALSPDAPTISSTIVGLEDRRQIEKITCDLVNKRDRLIRAVGHKLKKIGALAHPMRAERNDDIILGAHTLTRVEELLEDCFNALEQHTGQLIAHVSWQCPQSNPDMTISGYKILIDGKQYGNAMHSGVKTVRIKLGLEQSSYKLSLVSMSEKPVGTSEESNIVELLSTPFKPFSFYCYHAIHNKDTSWPSYGCCKYQDSITYERQVAKKLANQGLLQKHVPPPACSLLDVFDGEYKPLMGAHKPQHPTVLLFWTPWCLPSQQVMSYYTRFARETSKEFSFVAVTCGMSGISVSDRKSLVHLITSNGWREDGMVWHCTSECSTNTYEAANNLRRASAGVRIEGDLDTEKHLDLTELLGIAGVPTFLFLHPDGYIAWHGRYSAFDYSSFSSFMRHTMSEVLRQPCPVYSCDCCKNDMSLDDDLFNSGLVFTNENSRHGSAKNVTICMGRDDTPSAQGSRYSPSHEAKYQNGFMGDHVTSNDRIFLRRKSSPKRKKNRISVNNRPFSASASVSPNQLQNSPYLSRLLPASHPVVGYRSRNRPVSAHRLQHYV